MIPDRHDRRKEEHVPNVFVLLLIAVLITTTLTYIVLNLQP